MQHGVPRKDQEPLAGTPVSPAAASSDLPSQEKPLSSHCRCTPEGGNAPAARQCCLQHCPCPCSHPPVPCYSGQAGARLWGWRGNGCRAFLWQWLIPARPGHPPGHRPHSSRAQWGVRAVCPLPINTLGTALLPPTPGYQPHPIFRAPSLLRAGPKAGRGWGHSTHGWHSVWHHPAAHGC